MLCTVAEGVLVTEVGSR